MTLTLGHAVGKVLEFSKSLTMNPALPMRDFILDRIQIEDEGGLVISRARINSMLDSMFRILGEELDVSNIKEGLLDRLPKDMVLRLYELSPSLFPRGEELCVNRKALLVLQDNGD